MGFLLAASRIYVPEFIKRRALHELSEATAEAFQCKAPSVDGLSFQECLTEYALFTTHEAQRAIQQQSQAEAKHRLYENACRLGQRLKRGFRIGTIEEVMQMGEVVYGILRIDFHGGSQGDVLISRCFFSSFYSPDVCRIIASLDEGLLAGLSGGGKLSFSRRITEGGGCCQAHLSSERNST